MIPKVRKNILLLLSFVLPFSIVFPTLFMNELSLINDGINVLTAQRMLDQSFLVSFQTFGDTGRFFPAYFWYHGLTYALFGLSPKSFYMVHGVVLLITCLVAFKISKQLTRSSKWASLAVPFLLLSSSFPENFYSLGNAESLCALYLALAFWIFLKEGNPSPSRPFYKAFINASCITLLLTLCFLTKESTLIVLPLGLLIWVIDFLFVKLKKGSKPLNRPSILLLGSIPGAIIFWVLRSHYEIPSISQGQYTQQVSNVFSNFSQIFFGHVMKSPDVFIEAFLLLTLIALFFIPYTKPYPPETDLKQILFLSLIGFAFLGVYLFWPRAETYFFWISHFFFTPALILGFAVVHRTFVQNRFRRGSKVFIFSFLIGVLVLSRWVGGVIAQNQARSLITWNQINGDLLRYLSAQTPSGARIVFWNYDFPHELIFESELQLHHLYGRRDLQISGLGGNLQKRSFLFQPGDYLVINFGNFSPSLVTFRGPIDYPKEMVFTFLTNMGYLLYPVYEIGSQWSLFNPIRLRASLFVSGWEIFEIVKPGAVRNCDLFIDGWMGKTGNFLIENKRENSILQMNFTTIRDNALTGFFPIVMKILVDGEIRQEKVIEKAGQHSLSVPLDKSDHLVPVTVLSEKTFSPQSVHLGSKDSRQLSFHFNRIALFPEKKLMPHALSDSSFNAQIIPIRIPSILKSGQFVFVPVRVMNLSKDAWPVRGLESGAYQINVSYHWSDRDGKMIVYDGVRTPLTRDIGPGEEEIINAHVKAPDSPGNYVLEFDLVQEGVAWFKGKGSRTLKIEVEVTPPSKQWDKSKTGNRISKP